MELFKTRNQNTQICPQEPYLTAKVCAYFEFALRFVPGYPDLLVTGPNEWFRRRAFPIPAARSATDIRKLHNMPNQSTRDWVKIVTHGWRRSAFSSCIFICCNFNGMKDSYMNYRKTKIPPRVLYALHKENRTLPDRNLSSWSQKVWKQRIINQTIHVAVLPKKMLG